METSLPAPHSILSNAKNPFKDSFTSKLKKPANDSYLSTFKNPSDDSTMKIDEPISLTIAPIGAGPADNDLKLVVGNMLKSDSVMHLKRTIARDVRRPAEWSNINLYWSGTKLDNDKTLQYYAVENGDEILQVGAFDLGQRLGKPDSRAFAPQKAYKRDNLYGTWNRPVVDGVKIKNMFFKDLDGKSFSLQDIAIKITVRQLKEILWREKDFEREYLRLMYAGKTFEDDNTLEHYNVQEECTVIILARLPGGTAFGQLRELS